MENNVLIVLGVGRSGTSLVSNWLHQCGLNMGDYLLEPDWRNTKGFFEDKEIVDFQKKIFKRHKNRIFKDFFLKENILEREVEIEEKTFLEAIEIIKNRNLSYKQWGWKDPRTVLFMNSLWHPLLPNAKILFVYRDFKGVIGSLNRLERKFDRSNKFLAIQKNLKYLLKIEEVQRNNARLEGWIYQNKVILDFLKEKKKLNDYCIINSNVLLDNPNLFFKKLTNTMKFDLKYINPNKIYDKSLFKKEQIITLTFDKSILNRAEQMLKELNQLSGLTLAV